MKKLSRFIFMALLCAGILGRGARASSSMEDGLTAYYQKNWTAAQQNFRKAVNEDPQNSLPLVYDIVCGFWNSTAERDIRNAEDNLNDNPSDQLSQIRLGFMYYTRALVHGSKPDEALSAFREAARLGPSPLLHTGFGILYYDEGNFTRAKKELARAMDAEPADVLPYEYMGRILLNFDQDPQSAVPYFRQEIKLLPAYPDGHYYYAAALDAEGKTDEAAAEYQNTMALDPLGIGRGLDAKVALGDLYLRQKQYNDARKSYEDALKLSPNDPVIKLRLEELAKAQNFKKK